MTTNTAASLSPDQPEPNLNTGELASSSEAAQDPSHTVAPENSSATAETSALRLRRHAQRVRLYCYAVVTVAAASLLVVLAAANTAAVRVDWLFGTPRVSLILLILVVAVLGWVLGLLTSMRFHWRTKAPRVRG